jgi:F-type H+-transporting ATPase subunit c
MELEAAQALAPSLVIMGKALGAGLAMTGAIGAGAGVGIVVGGAVQAIARNPDTAGTIQANMILGIAFAEAIAIYALVVALIVLFVL